VLDDGVIRGYFALYVLNSGRVTDDPRDTSKVIYHAMCG
jgi:hypothetical protein